jgi:hypothetical protein
VIEVGGLMDLLSTFNRPDLGESLARASLMRHSGVYHVLLNHVFIAID